MKKKKKTNWHCVLLSSSGGEHIKMVVQDVVACVGGCVEMEVVVVVNV